MGITKDVIGAWCKHKFYPSGKKVVLASKQSIVVGGAIAFQRLTSSRASSTPDAILNDSAEQDFFGSCFRWLSIRAELI